MTIYNVKIYTQNKDRDIIDGFISFENGVITKVCQGTYENISEGDIDGGGKTLYPGFIDAHTHLGLPPTAWEWKARISTKKASRFLPS